MRLPIALLLVASLGLPGCGIGLIYTRVTTPLDTDFHETPVVRDDDTGSGEVNTLQYYVRINWGDQGIGELAKKHGFEKVYYADLETLSILNGLFQQRTVHIYGERADP